MRKTVAAIALALGAAGVLVVTTSDDTPARREVPGRGLASPRAAASGPRTVPLHGAPLPVSPLSPGAGRAGGASEEARPASRPSEPRTLEATVSEDVARIASAIDLDAATRASIEELTLRAFHDFQDEQARRQLPPDEVDRLLSARQAELHARIIELLPPGKRPHYREVVGLGP